MMNQEDIFKKIGQILNELQDQYDFLAQNPQQLNELELELFLANANFLTDHVQIVRKLNNNRPVKELPAHHDITPPVLSNNVVQEVVALPLVNALFEEVVIAQETSAPEPVLILEQIEREELQQEDVEPVQLFKNEKPLVQEESVEQDEPLEHESVYEELAEEEPPLKLDHTVSSFEFILSEESPSDKFEFEEQSVHDIFDRELSKEEADIIAKKQELRDRENSTKEEEPYLITKETSRPEDTTEEKEILAEPVNPAVIDKIEEQPVVYRETPKEYIQPVYREAPKEPAKPAAHFQSLFSGTERSEPFKAESIEPSPVTPAPVNPAQKDNAFSARPTLNEMLAGKSNSANLNEENSKTSITDLKGAINMNEKLLYIKDLFNGYNLAYSEAIDLINKMPDLKTADAFLKNNYAAKNNWESKQTTVDKFYELLKQRFPEA